MATTYGLTANGWLSKPLSVVQSELDAGLQKIVGASAATEPDGTIPLRSQAGQLKALMTDGFAAMWDQLQALAASVDPTQATDSALDVVCSISGTKRNPAVNSTVVATCTGTPGTVLQPSRAATVQGTGARFISQGTAATIASVNAWGQSTSYLLGNRVTANGNVYQCTQAGFSSNLGTGPSGTTPGVQINDNTAKWNFLGQGTGAVDVLFAAEQAGAIGALSYTLINIATPVSGWQGVSNVGGAAVGSLLEENSALRRRRDAELAASGNTTPNAIRAKMLAVNQDSKDPLHLPIANCTVFKNDTDVTDANGVPPHSVEVLVYYNSGITVATTDQDIANAVFAAVGAGTNTSGNQVSTVVDSQGVSQTVRWSKPTPVDIWIVATVYYDASKWPTTGAAALVQQAALSALLTFGGPFPVGQSVRASPLSAAVIDGPSATDTSGAAVVPAPAGAQPAPGILDVSPMFIGTAPAPGSSAPITIGTRQVARFQSANISLTALAATP